MPPRSKRASVPKPDAPTPPRALAGGRVSLDNSNLFIGSAPVIEPPTFPEDIWHWGNLDSKTLSRMSAGTVSGFLVDLSPEVSRALYDFLRECNPGWELTALRPGTEEPDEQAQPALDAIMTRLGLLYGSPDVVINRLFISAWLRGALFAELVLDEAGREVVDLATPDPYWVRFQRMPDPVRGTIHQLGQFQGGRFVLLDRPTISYIPVDPVPGVPYGRSLVAPALFTALFLLGMLHDLRRVVSQQGYPRPDIEIDLEKLALQMPTEIQRDPGAQQIWLQGIVDAVSTAYASLEPDDAYVHTSVVKLNKPMGTVDTASLGGIDAIITALERMAVRALKTAPFMMAMSESTTETQANRQYEQHVAGIKSIQHLAEALLERLFTLALQAQGVVSTVQMRFAENRAAELLRDAQVDVLKLNVATGAYTAGFFSQDEASQYAVGKGADVPEPRASAAPPAPTASPNTVNPEPGASRSAPASDAPLHRKPATGRDSRAKIVPLGHDQPFDDLVPLESLTDDERAALSGVFDRGLSGKNGKYKGLLDAEVVE